ncbi:winged helix DNA-binding domain-containing protein [Nonomuraea rhodomycinica]|uniref:Winged helix DNA-binding domain-containing protein n=1 Tax=Nonomuraea rhodomycinica TaxID=1712872 RepID=A0A7Y6ITC4_9ACTN|nr:winged helix DNA-binding domain-containing protein [Nonomuraea rhodomycinica]NUW44032.1 winged helix DNA-binding domain-containing protein [Nonomuraea rhodomycinica]
MRSVEAQLLHRPPGLGAGEVVRRLLAVQAQDVPSACLAFRARSPSLLLADVESAWRDREIVRVWGPRGTLHFVHADDLPWLHAVTRRDAATLRRLAQEGVSGDDLLPLIEGALSGQGPLTKAELEERLAGRARGQGVVHLVALAAFHGLAVLAPPRGGKPTYVHAADWLGAPITPEPDRERALAELARRYRRAHRPSEPEDLAAWSGLSLGEARTAWRLSGPGPSPSPGPNPDTGLGTGTPDPLPAEDVPVRLVPAFDEFLLGWKSRDPVVPAAHARQVFPGGGILRPVVLAGGVAAGVWERRGAEATVKPFGPLPAEALAEEVADVRRFLTPTKG